jgi:hypothetical protein
VRPIVHIGVHKTATDWFQKKVYPSAASHRLINRTRVREALIEPAPFISAICASVVQATRTSMDGCLSASSAAIGSE